MLLCPIFSISLFIISFVICTNRNYTIYHSNFKFCVLMFLSTMICTWLIGIMQSEKTSVMTTPKHPGTQIWQIYPRFVGRSNPPIEHRCLEYHYTKLGRSTPPQSSIDALNTITLNLADLPQISWQIYPPQLSIDALNTVTPNVADLPQITWQIYPPIEHRCLAYHYTKLAMHHGIYIMGCIWQPFWIVQEKVGISFYFWIIRVVISQLAL